MRISKDRFGQVLYCGPTDVSDPLCIWRSCFSAHDCGYTNSRGKWVRDGQCLRRYHHGCPDNETWRSCCDNPEFAPIRRTHRHKPCRNCGLRVPVEVIRSIEEERDGKHIADTLGDQAN